MVGVKAADLIQQCEKRSSQNELRVWFILGLIIIGNLVFGQDRTRVINEIYTDVNPLKTLRYYKIFAYNLNYDSATQLKTHQQIEFVNSDDYKLTKPYVCSKRLLSDSLTSELISILSDTTRFGNNYADCFEPRLAFQFLNKQKEVFRVLVCEECGYLISTEPLPAAYEKYYETATVSENGNPIIYRRYLKGFSSKGANRITALCKSLGMLYYKNRIDPK